MFADILMLIARLRAPPAPACPEIGSDTTNNGERCASVNVQAMGCSLARRALQTGMGCNTVFPPGAVLAQGYREQGVAHDAALAQLPSAAARAFEIHGRQIVAVCNRAVGLIGVEPLQFGGSNSRAKDPEHRPGVKAARHDGRDELGGHALHDLIAGNGVAIFTRDGDAAREFANRIQIGTVGVNVPIPVPMAFYSFGG
jgi:hypothetical protein